MDSRLDFQRILEDMDKVILAKRRELEELEDKLDEARSRISKTLAEGGESISTTKRLENSGDFEGDFIEQRKVYENQIAALNDELNELEALNVQIVKENKELKFNIESSRIAFDSIRIEFQSLSETCLQLTTTNEELRLKLVEAEQNNQTNLKLLEKSNIDDEILMKAFNVKLDAMQAALEEKDSEISKLRDDNKFAMKLFGIEYNELFKGESDNKDFPISTIHHKQNLFELASVFREKEEQIELLKTQLNQATQDLERNASLMESVKLLSAQRVLSMGKNDDDEQDMVTRMSTQDIVKRLKLMESELEDKDKYLHQNEQKLHHYEAIVPRVLNVTVEKIRDLLNGSEEERRSILPIRNEIDFRAFVEGVQSITTELEVSRKLLNSLEVKDKHIMQLIEDLNGLGAKYNHLQHQLVQLKGEHITSINDPSASTKETLLSICAHPNSGSSFDVDVDANANANANANADVEVEQPKASIDKKKIENSPKPSVRKSIVPLLDSQRCRELESENQLLELAMKEILMSIKWSDAQCRTILIDCPALERFCQLIEARYLTKLCRSSISRLSMSGVPEIPDPGYLFQLITIKSELDLLRGQNEQLRADLKLQTREYFQTFEDSKTNEEKEKSDFACQTHLINKDDETNEPDVHLKRIGERASPKTDPTSDLYTSTMSQTDIIHLDANSDLSPSISSWLELKGSIQQQEARVLIRHQTLEKCENCTKLTKFSSHLLQCIVRVEGKVTLSEEICMSRLRNLQSLIRMLEKDLEIRVNLLNKTLREKSLGEQQRKTLETRLDSVETQLRTHIKECPSYNALTRDINLISNASNRDDLPMRNLYNPTSTISLLKAIIVCLQARLCFKDRRLEQLEAIFASDKCGCDKISNILGERRQSR